MHFDLCVIGSGSGLAVFPPDITAQWRVALVDAGIGPEAIFGGTCLNAGCIPTKMFTVPASLSQLPSDAARVNVNLSGGQIDFPALRERIFARTDAISQDGLAWQLTRENVEVFREVASFIDPHTLQVGEQTITADRFVLAAGSRPRELDVPGFDEPWLQAFVHTSDTIMRVDEVPRRLVILGGGTEAVEFAHVFAALGSQVTVVNRSAGLLSKEDDDVAALVTRELGKRVAVRVNQQVTALEPGPDGGVLVVTQDAAGVDYSYQADAVLKAVGRVPNSDVLAVERAGVEIDERGFVKVDERQRTSQPHIYAMGDLCNPNMLKHLANAQSRVVLQELRAQCGCVEPEPMPAGPVPYGIFTEPEVAVIGINEREAQGIEHVVHSQEFASVAYGWALNDEKHFVKLIGSPDGKLLGAHIVGPQATTLLQPLIMYVQLGLDAYQATRGQFWIHPALTEVVENALLGLAVRIKERQ